MTNSETLTATIEAAKLAPRTAGPAAQGYRYAKRVIGGHMVQVNLFGFLPETATMTIWVDGSTEPLTEAEALARIVD